MPNIFLSASVPIPGRGDFHTSANPFLIQFAVRELLSVCLGRRRVIWGGHPAITPMIWAICEDLGVNYAKAVKLYQSTFFKDEFPAENAHFSNVVYVDAVDNEMGKSLDKMRQKMLEEEFNAGVFIGGMEGIFTEHQLFSRTHPDAKVLVVSSPGGAAMNLAGQLGQASDRIDFARLFFDRLGIDPGEPRDQIV